MASSASSRRIFVTALVAIVAIAAVLALWSLIDSAVKARKDRASQTYLNDMQSQAYDLLIHAQEATLGNAESIALLPTLSTGLSNTKSQFDQSEKELGTPERLELGQQVTQISSNISTINEQAESVVFLNDQLETLEQSIPQIQQAYTNVVDTMLRSETPSDQIAEAQAQVWRAERVLTSLNRILIGTDDPVAAAEQFRQDVLIFNQVLVGMKEGNLILGISRVESPETRQLLDQVETQFLSLNDSIQSFIDASPSLAAVGDAGRNIQDSAGNLLQTTNALSGQISELPVSLKTRPFSTQTAIIASIVLAAALAGLALLVYRNVRSNLRETEDANDSNQEAIIRLLDEIADLGEGDLRVKATVSEDFTGAIADAINYAIEQLRVLVSDVANTAESVSASSNETRATSIRLSEASEHQARQITEASASINQISNNLSKVSEDAEELANVAQSSVSVARNGAEVVQNTIDGMNNIREQIQDTSKRIKRLGESSQEIGDIVSLINEIADQTNILALNASIQAAMAGEAGRGFAVVADEVQGLAERAASSTKQIETLVKTIQSDTNEAVASMEQTTAEVVRGAQLANDAGSALNEIQSTSENLAKLILAIATETQDQSTNANRIVGTMSVIQDISSETLEGTTASANAVGELAEQAQALRESISDFKLPSNMSESGAVLMGGEVANLETNEDILGLNETDSLNDALPESSDTLEDLTSEAEGVEQFLNENSSIADSDTAMFGADESTQEEVEDHVSDILDNFAEENAMAAGNDDFDDSVYDDMDVAAADVGETISSDVEDVADDDFSFSDEDFLTFDLDDDDAKA